MSRVNDRSGYWLWIPVLVWMAVIFTLSANPNPPVPHLGDNLLDLLIRKAGHLTEYAILALLAYRPLHANPRALVIAFLIASLYAATDEWHQTFVPPRDGNPTDWIIDSTGAATGLLMGRVFRQRG